MIRRFGRFESRRSCCVGGVLAIVALAGSVVPASATAAQKGRMAVRFIVDLEDSLTHEAIDAYRRAFTKTKARAAVHFHHLPLRRHQRARIAALAALAARKQGKETAFVRHLLTTRTLDDKALNAAAIAAKLDLAQFGRDRVDPLTERWLSAERQALVALGVRATPSAIINGRGLGGLPPRRALEAAVTTLWSAAKRCLKTNSSRDCELRTAGDHAQASLPAYKALVDGKGVVGQNAANRPVGRLGLRYRVSLRPWDLRSGPSGADVTAVMYLDPASSRQRRALAELLRIARDQRDRVVVKLLPRTTHAEAASGLQTSLALTAIATKGSKASHRESIAALAGEKPLPPQMPRIAASAGLVGGALDIAVAAPQTTVALDDTIRSAARVDGRPGSIYINGRKWLGRADDDGIDQIFELARGEAFAMRKRGVKRKKLYASMIRRGRVRSEAEADLDDPEDLGDLSAIPTVIKGGDGAVPVYLFVDFRSLASRAAFHILTAIVEGGEVPMALSMASMASSAEPAVTASGAAFVATHIRGRGLAGARRLLALRDPNDWRLLRSMWRSIGLNRKLLQPTVADPRLAAVVKTVRRLRTVFEMDVDPVIYIGGRRYIGPIDEARIERAVRFMAKRQEKAAP